MPAHRHAVVLFGELLLRLEAPAHQRLPQATSFDVRFTGAEANAGVSLAQFGAESIVASKVPLTDIGDACIGYLRKHGLSTAGVQRGGERLGLFYLETGAAQRPSKVLYDRAGSAFAQSGPEDYDWHAILDGTDWLHFSGTAPAVGPRISAAIGEGLALAEQLGITTSCDLNFRRALWTPAEASRVMRPLLTGVDVLIANEEDIQHVLGIKAEGSDVVGADLDAASYRRVARQAMEAFGFRHVATTLRESYSASHNGWAGLLSDGEHHWLSKRYDVSPIVDRIGAGDAFAGALIYALLQRWPGQQSVDFATAASCLKHAVPGDFNLTSVEEVQRLMDGDASGRVQR